MKTMCISFLCAGILSGCAGIGVEGVRIALDKKTIQDNIESAKRGDAEAQFKVGEAYCCSPHEEAGAFYDTKSSIAWLCASARQGHAPAMFKLGKIYSGDVVDGIRLIRRAAMKIAGSSTNKAVAYTWLRQAADRGIVEAGDEAAAVWNALSPAERDAATISLRKGLHTQCDWDDVIGLR